MPNLQQNAQHRQKQLNKNSLTKQLFKTANEF